MKMFYFALGSEVENMFGDTDAACVATVSALCLIQEKNRR
jgi:hypothetical protein